MQVQSTIHIEQTKFKFTLIEPVSHIKLCIWFYCLLLIFEGALRKWVLPGLSTPLLIVRDPVALWLIIRLWRLGLFPNNKYITGMGIIGLLSIFTAVLVGHGNIFVALYGARLWLLHFPIIFIIGRFFTYNDVVRFGRILLYISIPMGVLIAVQFYSPQSALINRGIGGNIEGGGFSGALGYFRPPATFSFTNGTHLFFGFVASFVFYFWLNTKYINRLVLITATITLLAAIPLSISRSLFFHVISSLVFTTVAISRKPKYLGKLILAVLFTLGMLSVLNQTSFFQTATLAFKSRFEGATEIEGGIEGTIGTRYLGGMIDAIYGISNSPFFGYGLGIGTSVGGKILFGQEGLQISEDEWARVIGELGPLMGIIIILLRANLCVKIARLSYQRLKKGDFLSWMLLSFGLLVVPQGQWAQPTSLGFGVVIGGLMIASLKVPDRQL